MTVKSLEHINGETTFCEVLERLYDCEINCGLQSFWDGGWRVWIGDDMNGITHEKHFEHLERAKHWFRVKGSEVIDAHMRSQIKEVSQ